MSLILIALGWILSIVGGIWFLIKVFDDSIGWGIGCILLPFLSLVYLIMNFSDVKNPFFVQLAGSAFYIVGFMIAPEAVAA